MHSYLRTTAVAAALMGVPSKAGLCVARHWVCNAQEGLGRRLGDELHERLNTLFAQTHLALHQVP